MSTVAAYKTELVALLTAGMPTLQVIYGPAVDVTILGPDVLSVGNVAGSMDRRSLGATGSARESYDVDLTVSCSRPGPDAQVDATAAALGFRDAAAALLAAAVPATAGVLSAQVTGPFAVTEDNSPSAAIQRNAVVTFAVHVESST